MRQQLEQIVRSEAAKLGPGLNQMFAPPGNKWWEPVEDGKFGADVCVSTTQLTLFDAINALEEIETGAGLKVLEDHLAETASDFKYLRAMFANMKEKGCKS